MKKILFVYGTRPEAIKMAPLVCAFKSESDRYETRVCLTGQHRQMLDQVNDFFSIQADYDLNLMQPNQTLFDITAKCLKELEAVLEDFQPHVLFVQGDTTSVMVGALAAYYKHIDVAHLEAGLRSGNIYSPFPEEMNRKIASQIALYHFAPTKDAAENLQKDGIVNNIHVVGNTVIDALHLGLKLISEQGDESFKNKFNFINFSKKVILVTGHRRESFGSGFENICAAIKEIALSYDVEIVYPVHLNPNVQGIVKKTLAGIANVHLLDPLQYPEMIWLMNKSYFVLTDSGGIQEEAPALGKPVLVMREVTERMEGVAAGTAKLVGVSRDGIVNAVQQLLCNIDTYNFMAKAVNPYGDGTTSKKIVSVFNHISN